MKKKQLILKQLQKGGISQAKILSEIDRSIPLLGIEEIATHFVDQRNHQEELQSIDAELLEIVLTRLMENPEQESQVIEQKKKIDVLTFGEAELLAFCREKSLISLHEYCSTRQNKSYRSHSDYGYMLVSAFPDEFEVGPRCTHYHCKTRALTIERQYGIYNTALNTSTRDDNQLHQSDQDFINNSESQSEHSQIVVRRKAKKGKKIVQKSEQKPKKDVKKKKKNMSIQDSDEQEQKEVKNHKKTKGKMQVKEQQQGEQKYDGIIYKALAQLQVKEILETIDYKAIFEFLSENHIQRLRPLLEIISETVMLNNKESLRQRSKKNKKQHKKRLTKMKVNLKSLTLEELIALNFKNNIISEEDYEGWQLKYQLEDHPRVAYELLQAQPDDYVIQGNFIAYPDEKINELVQDAYEEYENEEVEDEEDGQEEKEESQFLEEDADEGDSNYSIDPDEEDLGII